MAIRDKLKKTFGKSSSGGSSPSKGSTDQYYTGRTDIEYYKPHEIPKSKYRGRVDKEHQASLESYSFADAFTTIRRRSSQALSGIMSPGGTKAQSRRPSYVSRASRTTRGSVSSQGGSDFDGLSRPITPALQPPHADITRVDEASDEEKSPRIEPTFNENSSQHAVPTVRLDRTATVEDRSQYDQPFSASELEKAMTKATLRANNDHFVRRSSVVAY